MIGLRGALESLDAAALGRLLGREGGERTEIEHRVAELIDEVRREGDAALLRLAKRFDDADLDSIEVPRAAWDAALERLEPDLVAGLRDARSAVLRAHRAQLPRPVVVESRPGCRIVRRPVALGRVGVYAPGGRAAYPSTVLMCCVPARVAGVAEIVVCSPPGAGGQPADVVQAACALAGADRLYALGGAGAIAAMALGTPSVAAVDKVVGPGNAWVEEAKRQLAREVAADAPAGPSEILVLADATANADVAAAEMLAQAEHDPMAAVVLVATEAAVCDSVAAALEARLARLPNPEVAAAALARGALLSAASRQAAIDFAERYAPEHLLLLMEDAEELAASIGRAGTVLFGEGASVALSDYATGASHVLPTGGRAAAESGLGVDAFVRWINEQRIDRRGAAELAATARRIACAEGLPAHAAAAELAGARAAEQSAAGFAPPWRQELRELQRYEPADLSTIEIDLSDNTNRFGAAPSALRAIHDLDESGLREYPTAYGDRLKDAIAEVIGLDAGFVATGCGSDDLIDACMRAFVDPGGSVAHSDPTFSMVPVFARINALRPVGVPASPDLEIDLEGLVDADADLTYLCRPENPTGALPAREAVRQMADRCSGVLLIDEAYLHFAGEPTLGVWASTTDRVVVLRTFSKAFGLAGVRAGCAFGPAELIERIETARGPYTLNVAAEVAATAAVRHDAEWLAEIVERSVHNRERLAAALGERGLAPWPSATNFLLMPTPPQCPDLGARLARAGIAVREMPGLTTAGDCLRVTVGPWAEMERLLAAIDGALGT